MALQKLTFLSLKRAVLHALTHAPDATVSTEGEIVNDAITQFAMLHEWQWLQSTTFLEIIDGQAYSILPADFGQMREVHGGSASQTVRMVTPAELVKLRTQGQAAAGGGDFRAAVMWAVQAAVTDMPRARLELFPTPTSTIPSALGCIYTRQPAILVADTDTPDVPAFAQQALKAYIRATALAEDNQANAAAEMQRAMMLIDAAKDYDGLLQTDLGVIRGGAGEFADSSWPSPEITILP